MSAVQQVETAVGEADPMPRLATAVELGQKLLKVDNFTAGALTGRLQRGHQFGASNHRCALFANFQTGNRLGEPSPYRLIHTSHPKNPQHPNNNTPPTPHL